MKVYVLLPVYNEAQTLEAQLHRVRRTMEDRNLDYEIIAYNDGSTDGSTDVLERNRRLLPLKVIGKEQNKGLGVAFESLLREAATVASRNDDVVIVQDSDNTHNPEHAYSMINRIRDGFDVVIASRYRKDSRVVGVSFVRQSFSLVASWIMRILFPIKGVKDYTCGYRAYSVGILRDAFATYNDRLVEENGFACMAELLVKLRPFKILAVEVPILLRYDSKVGGSKMKVAQTIRQTLLMLLRLKVRSKRAPRSGR